MKITPTLLTGIVIALGGAMVWFWPGPSGPETDQNQKISQDPNFNRPSPSSQQESRAHRSRLRDSSKGPTPWKTHPDTLKRYAPDMEEHFYTYSDQGVFYKSKGLMDYFKHMREALQGDANALANIFTFPSGDGAASEGYQSALFELLGALGDHYFAYQLEKQPAEVQLRTLSLIWPNRSDDILKGTAPLIRDQECHHTAKLMWNLK